MGLLYSVTPILDTCQCDLGESNTDIIERIVEVGQEFTIEPFIFPAVNGFANCNATTFTVTPESGTELALDYRQGSDVNTRTLILSAKDKSIFNHNQDELVKVDLSALFADGTTLSSQLALNLTETIVCTGEIAFTSKAKTKLTIRTGEYLKYPIPKA